MEYTKENIRKGACVRKFLVIRVCYVLSESHESFWNSQRRHDRRQETKQVPGAISARFFNRDELARRVLQIGKWESKIHLSCKDAGDFLGNKALDSETLLYLDPPYFRAGRALYLNAYRPDDHEKVRDIITSISSPVDSFI